MKEQWHIGSLGRIDVLGRAIVTAAETALLAKRPLRSPPLSKDSLRREEDSCEFCRELEGDPQSYFSQIYKSYTTSRIVTLSSRFVALPTIGQLLPRWVMILPVKHYRCFAQIPPAMHIEAASMITDVAARMASGDPYLAFEHGSRKPSGGCGIGHAHVHVVPVPSPVPVADIIRVPYETASSMPAAWLSLRQSSDYLVVRNTGGAVAFIKTTALYPIRSQFMRQSLAQIFSSKDLHWDWRQCTEPEPNFFDALAKLRE